MPGTAINSSIVNTNNNSTAAHPVVSTAANGSLVVDSIIKSTSNFVLNEDSNGIKDAAKKSARVIWPKMPFLSSSSVLSVSKRVSMVSMAMSLLKIAGEMVSALD